MNVLSRTIDGLQEVLGICPCCGELFRLIEAKFVFPARPPRSCEFLELLGLERKGEDENGRMNAAEERFSQKFEEQCEQKARGFLTGLPAIRPCGMGGTGVGHGEVETAKLFHFSHIRDGDELMNSYVAQH